MKYLFLDFDGVICTAKSYKQGDKQWQRDGNPKALGCKQGDNFGEGYGRIRDSDYNCGPYRIDADLAKQVQKVCDTQDEIVIVLSTTWRRIYQMQHLRTWLREKGITTPIIGRTSLYYHENEYERGHLIERWCVDNDVPIKDIVILDDNEILDPFTDRDLGNPIGRQFVHIERGFGKGGMSDKYVQQAIEILGAE